jgi:hypothetical protein
MLVFNAKAVVGAFNYTLVLRLDVGYIRLEIIDDNNIRNYTTNTCSNINSIEELERFITNYEQIKKIISRYTSWIDLDKLDIIDTPTLLDKMQYYYEESLLDTKKVFIKKYPEPEKRWGDAKKLIEGLDKLI